MRRDRWIQALVAAGVIALTVWIARHTYWDETTIATPPTGEAARNGYYALTHLTGSLGIDTRVIGSLRELPPAGIVLVSSLYDDLRHEPLENLQAWVQSGGRLIIGGDTLNASEPLQIWSGIKRVHGRSAAPRPATAGAPRAGLQVADGCAPLTLTVSIDGSPTGQSWVLCNGWLNGYESERVPSWSLSDSSGIRVLRVPIGRGELTVLGPNFMLSNWNLPKRDDAQIFVAAAGLRHGDRLEILSATRATPLPVLLWRLAAPAILFLAGAVLLLLWRHLPRFGPPLRPDAPIRRSLAEQIRANARFAWRTRKLQSLRAAIRRALDEAAQKRIAGFALMSPSKQAQALAAHTGLDAATINAALVSGPFGGINEHRAAIMLLEACRRILVSSHFTQGHRV
ncbi:MAG TPA: DUF4350 domain-containing protein [Steroidobacteraceae bacterium]|jgi:hypothetical protein|nr:DUF4350 domain-containing protein [Steroidobacteraceae bacterium]